MNVDLLDLNRQYATIKDEVDDAIHEVLDSQYFIMGDTVKDFEKKVQGHIKANFAYGCASGSDALLLALMAIDIQPGDLVLTSPFTFFATAGAVSRLGAIPVFLDIEKDSFNLDPKQLEAFLAGDHPVYRRLKPNPEAVKAVIPVHIYGQMADMDPINKLAKKHNLSVIEDAAQAIGAQYKGNNAGTMGDFGCFSFFPSKNLGAYGDAGLITVKDSDLADKTDILRLHGAKPKYYHSLVGINSRLDAIQAAVLSVKLKYLDEWSEQRRRIAMTYNQLFEEAGVTIEIEECKGTCRAMGGVYCDLPSDKIVLPKETTGNPADEGRHIYHQYTIRSKRRDELAAFLNEKGIGNAVYYPVSLHEQQCFAYLGYRKEDCPVSVCASQQAISLPIFPELKEDEIEYVAETIIKFLKS